MRAPRSLAFGIYPFRSFACAQPRNGSLGLPMVGMAEKSPLALCMQFPWHRYNVFDDMPLCVEHVIEKRDDLGVGAPEPSTSVTFSARDHSEAVVVYCRFLLFFERRYAIHVHAIALDKCVISALVAFAVVVVTIILLSGSSPSVCGCRVSVFGCCFLSQSSKPFQETV